MTRLPSLVGAACIVLALHYLELPVEPRPVHAVTGYTLAQLKSCVLELRRVHKKESARVSTRANKRHESVAPREVMRICWDNETSLR